MTDFPDWQAPQAHATAISVTGAPALNLHSVLGQATAVIAGGASVTIPASGKFTVGQVSYEIGLKLGSGGSPAPAVDVELFWTDSVSGLQADYQIFSVLAGSTGFEHLIHGKGPSNADQLQVKISAFVSSVTAQYFVAQSSRDYPKHLWRTVNPNGVPAIFSTFTLAPGDPGAGILLAAEDSLAASTGKTYLLPLYTGDVMWNGRDNGGVAALSTYFIHAVTETGFTDNIIYPRGGGQSGFAGFNPSSQEGPVTLPRVQCTHEYKNTNTSTTRTLSATIIARQE